MQEAHEAGDEHVKVFVAVDARQVVLENVGDAQVGLANVRVHPADESTRASQKKMARACKRTATVMGTLGSAVAAPGCSPCARSSSCWSRGLRHEHDIQDHTGAYTLRRLVRRASCGVLSALTVPLSGLANGRLTRSGASIGPERVLVIDQDQQRLLAARRFRASTGEHAGTQDMGSGGGTSRVPTCAATSARASLGSANIR